MPITTRIASVQVYRQGALVTRTGELTLGEEHHLVEGLPLVLLDASVRVFVEGHAPSDVRVDWVLPELGATLQTVTAKEREELEWRSRELRDKLQVIATQKSLLRMLQPELPEPTDGEVAPATPVDTWMQAIDWRRQMMQTLDRGEDGLQRELHANDEQLQRLIRAQAELARHADARAAGVSKRVSFRLPPAEGQAQMRLEYRVPGAKWVPTYELRVAKDGSAAELGVRALVVQHTGEAWERVALTLSTAALERDVDLSELHALRIGRAQPPPRPAFRPPPADTASLFAGFDAAQQDKPMPPPAMPPPMLAPSPMSAPSAPASEGRGREQKRSPQKKRAASMPPGLVAETAVAAPAPAMRARMSLGRAAEVDEPPAAFIAESPMDELAAAPEETAPPPLPPALQYAELRMSERGQLRAAPVDSAFHGAHRYIEAAKASAKAIHHYAFQSGTRTVSDSAGHFDYAYAAQALVDVPTDGRAHNVPLLQARAPVSLLLIAVPRESSDAVRVARLTNPLPSPLLEGPIDVYWDAEFLVQAPLWTTPAGGQLTVGLGVEPALKVARNVSFEEKTAGLLRGKIALDHDVKIDIGSRLERPVEIEVREILPTVRADDKETEIEIGRVDPAWEPYEQVEQPVQGGKRWRFKLSPGGNQQLNYRYSIRIDAKLELVGGNRRA